MFKGSVDMDLPNFSFSATQCVGSERELSRVFDPRPRCCLEHCEIIDSFVLTIITGFIANGTCLEWSVKVSKWHYKILGKLGLFCLP